MHATLPRWESSRRLRASQQEDLLPHRRRSQRRWGGRHPALRWRIQRARAGSAGVEGFGAPHAHFWCDTSDGVRLAGTRLGTNEDTAVIIVHGFMAYRTKPKFRTLAESLAQRFTVLTFDLRGHGQSEGACTGGEQEALDVEAVVAYARGRGYGRVVTVGASLGGIATLRHAALLGDVDAVVAISTPALWASSPSKAVRRMTWLFTSPVGRVMARRIMGTRIHLSWGEPEPPAELVGRIAPVPLLLVHGENDHFFPPEDAQMLFERAGEPKRLWMMPGFGHAEDGFTPEFAEQLAVGIEELLTEASSHR